MPWFSCRIQISWQPGNRREKTSVTTKTHFFTFSTWCFDYPNHNWSPTVTKQIINVLRCWRRSRTRCQCFWRFLLRGSKTQWPEPESPFPPANPLESPETSGSAPSAGPCRENTKINYWWAKREQSRREEAFHLVHSSWNVNIKWVKRVKMHS